MPGLNPRNGVILSLPILLLFGFIFLLSCQNKSAQDQVAEKILEKTIKQGTGNEANVEIQGGKIRFQTKEGIGEINTTKVWSEDIPADVPKFSMGKINGISTSDMDGKKSWSVVIEGIQEGVFPKYVEELKAKNWKITSTLTMGTGGTVSASKNDLNLMGIFYKDQNTGIITISKNN